MHLENGARAPTPSARRSRISGSDHYRHRHGLEARLERMFMENRTQFCRHATNVSEKTCRDAEEARHRLCRKEFVIGGSIELTGRGEVKRNCSAIRNAPRSAMLALVTNTQTPNFGALSLAMATMLVGDKLNGCK